jgi:hypothetical protein
MGASDIQVLPKDSRRVESWVYAVLNPLIDAVSREVAFLEEGNLTWRNYSRHCEHIRPIVEYIDARQLPVYGDFLSNEQAGFKDRFNEHDRKLAATETAATDAYRVLIQPEAFEKQIEQSLEEYESRVSSHEAGYRESLIPTAESLARAVAELLVNRADDLPYHHSTKKFWQDHREQFQRFRKDPAFSALSRAATAFKESSKLLSDHLVSHRLYLCGSYDIPPAPPAARRSREGVE